ncbi:MAG TPA: hypothetical protein VFZ33_03865 [Chitinophagaceae bacterium]
MGLSIHYSGTIRDISLIEPLIAETADVCQSMQWKYNVIREQGDEGVNGIVLSPENCEPVFLTFLPNRRMCSPINLKYQGSYVANGFDPELVYTTSTKTQYAGPATHVALLKFLKYLKEKYFERFELNDEGYYWETNDKKILRQRFDHYNYLVNAVGEVLSNIEQESGETIDSLVNRIEQVLKKNFDNGKKSD